MTRRRPRASQEGERLPGRTSLRWRSGLAVSSGLSCGRGGNPFSDADGKSSFIFSDTRKSVNLCGECGVDQLDAVWLGSNEVSPQCDRSGGESKRFDPSHTTRNTRVTRDKDVRAACATSSRE